MTKITFENENVLTVFLSMAEGMEEVQRDDASNDDEDGRESKAKADALVALIEVVGVGAEHCDYPRTIELPETLYQAAEDVLGNCLDNNQDWHDRDEAEEAGEGECVLFADEVTLSK